MPNLNTPASPETSAAAESQWADLCNEQGWNEASQIIHLEGFLRDHGLFPKFVAYAEAAAAEENSGSDEAAGALA